MYRQRAWDDAKWYVSGVRNGVDEIMRCDTYGLADGYSCSTNDTAARPCHRAGDMHGSRLDVINRRLKYPPARKLSNKGRLGDHVHCTMQ